MNNNCSLKQPTTDEVVDTWANTSNINLPENTSKHSTEYTSINITSERLLSDSESEDLIEKNYSVKDEEIYLTVDDVITKSGPCGIYQLLLTSAVTLICLVVSCQDLIIYFAADESPWTCVHKNSSQFCYEHFGENVQPSSRNFRKRCELQRGEWFYNQPESYSSVTEFNLVCSKEYMISISNSLYFFGSGFGSLIAGIIADRYGRRRINYITLVIMAIASMAIYFVTDITQLTFLRTIIGFSYGAHSVCAYVFAIEFLAPKYHVIASNISTSAYTISHLITTGLAYFFQNWRILYLFASIFIIPVTVLSFFLHESPQWLFATGRINQAKKVLTNIAKYNKVHLGSFELKQCGEEEELDKKRYSYVDLFKSSKVFSLIIMQCYIWFTSGLVYYGMMFGLSRLGSNVYTNLMLLTIADLPSYLFAPCLTKYLGHRKASLLSLSVSTLSFLPIILVPDSYAQGYTIKVIFAMIGRIFISCLINIMYIWSYEIFPTVVRSQGLNICEMAHSIGGAAAPFVTINLQSIMPSLPYIVMGCITFLATFISLLLPETHLKPTREYYEDFYSSQNEGNCDYTRVENLNINT